MIDIARNIVPCSDKQDMKSRNGSYFQPSFSTRKRQRISSDLFSELPQKRSKTTNGRIWTKATYSFSSQTLCTISSKVIRMWASFNVFALFFNGLALGCMWGVIFSFIEGRKVTDILASLLGVSMAVSSGMAKSLGLFVVNTFGVTEFWMPALIGGLAFPLLVLMGWSLNKLPSPTDEDRALRSERVALNGEQRRQLFKSYMPLLIMLFFANLFITILRDIKEDFLVNIIDVSTISSWLFAQVDGMVTLIILGIFAMMSLINSNYRVLIVLLSMVIGGAVTISYLAFNYDTLQLPTLYWLFIQSLSLYIVYLSFQTLFFERFIACFKIKGNVGFFIASIDFIGYTGTVCVLLFKEYCSPNIDWMQFYNQFSGWVGIVAGIAFIGSAIYLMQRYKMEKQNLPTECYHPTDNATNAFPQIQSTPTGNE